MSQSPVGTLIERAKPSERQSTERTSEVEIPENLRSVAFRTLAGAGATHTREQRRVDAQLVGQLHKQAPVGIIATLVNAFIIVFVLWDWISHNVLLIWLGASAAVALLRYGLISASRRAAFQKVRPESWGILQIAGFALSGMLWGSAGIFLFPQSSTAHQAFIAFVLAGMVAGAVGTCSSVLAAFVVFSLPALAPLLVRFLLVGDDLHTAMGGMTLLFAVLTFLTAKRVNRSARELVTLKENFADKVAERTTELIRTNEDLNREIEDRQRAEIGLRDSEQRIRMVIEHAQVVLWAFDQSGAVTLSEGRGLAALGLEPGEVVGRSFFEVYSAFPQIISDAREALKGNIVSSVTEIKDLTFESRFVPILGNGGEVTGAIGMAIDISAREKAEALIRLALREKEVLLKEIHHRVKNNLAVIISILKMQSSRIADPSAKEALHDCYDRVRAMALIHETLYQAEDLTAIPLAAYARNLADNLRQMMLAGDKEIGIRMVIEAEGVQLPIDEATPCGLILNELLTNALKYAFTDRESGQILISAKVNDDGVFELSVRDDGAGFPADLDPETSKTLGFHIISMLVKHQMEGAWEAKNDNGACVTIRWPASIEGKGMVR